MRSFLSAIQFLTIIPVKIKNLSENKFRLAMIYFPLVGLLLGLCLALINTATLKLGFDRLVASVITIVSLVALTGGLHLDGLSDTADAFLSRKNKEEMLKIMRDSHAGVMGILSLISIMLLKISFLWSIGDAVIIPSLVLMCVLSRWGMVLSMFLFPYAREEGKARAFMKGINRKIVILTAATAVLFSAAAWQAKGVLVFALASLVVYAMGKLINRKINGITGDTIGAINELTEVFVLLVICLMERIKLCPV